MAATRHSHIERSGFASSFRGNQLGEDVERRKLEQVVSIATKTWGSAK